MMTKYDFEDWLRHRLSDLPREELDRIAAYYRSAIEDRMEDGMTEEEAIYDLGEPEALLEGIRASLPDPVTYEPVRRATKSGPSARRWVALVLGLTGLAAALTVSFAVMNAPVRRAETLVAVPEVYAPMVDEAILWDEFSDDCAFDADTLEKIAVDAAFGSVLVEPSSDSSVHIIGNPEFYEAVRRGNTLYIENVEADFTLQIPLEQALRFEMTCDVGDVEIYEICPKTLNVSCDLGNISLHNVSALDAINLEADVGAIEGSLKGRQSDYFIDVEVDLGESNLLDQFAAGDDLIDLNITTDVGSIKIEFEE